MVEERECQDGLLDYGIELDCRLESAAKGQVLVVHPGCDGVQ